LAFYAYKASLELKKQGIDVSTIETDGGH
jgi:hypothetical protein